MEQLKALQFVILRISLLFPGNAQQPCLIWVLCRCTDFLCLYCNKSMNFSAVFPLPSCWCTTAHHPSALLSSIHVFVSMFSCHLLTLNSAPSCTGCFSEWKPASYTFHHYLIEIPNYITITTIHIIPAVYWLCFHDRLIMDLLHVPRLQRRDETLLILKDR